MIKLKQKAVLAVHLSLLFPVCVCVLNYKSGVRCAGVRSPTASYHYHLALLHIPSFH